MSLKYRSKFILFDLATFIRKLIQYLKINNIQSFSVVNFSLVTLVYIFSKNYVVTVGQILILFLMNYSFVIFLLFSIFIECASVCNIIIE